MYSIPPTIILYPWFMIETQNAADTPLVEDDTGCIDTRTSTRGERKTASTTMDVRSVSCRGPDVEESHEQPCER